MSEVLTTAEIVALKQELGRAALDGSWTTKQELLNTACNVAMASTFESEDRDEARQTIADCLNARSGKVTAETVTDEQIREYRASVLGTAAHDAEIALGLHLSEEGSESWYSSRIDQQDAIVRVAAAINARNAAVRK